MLEITQKIKDSGGEIYSRQLSFPKKAPNKPDGLKEYISSPTWFRKSWRDSLEKNLWDAGKLHDNDRGERGVIPKNEADKTFCRIMRYRGYNKAFVFLIGAYLKFWGK